MDRAPGPALAVAGLTVRYGARTALHRLSLDVPRGQFVALVGPNGSGKTTLLRAVLGFVAPAEGSVAVFGRPTGALSALQRAREVAWVPQDESPRDDVRLSDYVLYGRYPYHGPLDAETAVDRAIAEQVLRDVGLDDRAQDGILALSGGERQRAVLARALAQTTPLLLLDEPTSHLDIAHQLDLFARVRGLARDRSVTVVAAIHDLNLAGRFADRLIVLSRGQLFADGTPAEVLSRDLLARVWGISADLRRDPHTGVPYLIPQRLLTAAAAAPGERGGGPVHVVGGGGSASPYLRALADEGYRVTCGAIPLLDSDAETADALSLPTALELPFAPLGPEARARHRALLDEARAIVVGPFPVGPSNLANLEDLEPYAGRVPILLVRYPPIGERDFAAGRAAAAYERLRAGGAREVGSVEEALTALRALGTGALPTTASGAPSAALGSEG
ncbi:MAG TPA: ABC transporter ATP-binding protein [Thermoplasmata archaeon]|nr:ABC transporter ATP-binding protein [Thermoplasmata archaeon]